MTSIYSFTARNASGTDVPLSAYEGQVLLIVNVASKCGLTPQYEGLEALYRADKDRGFAVLGFPCNQFLGQEPGSDDEIQSFCKTTYDVSFPVFSKVDVNGPEAHPLYKYLKAEAPGDWGPQLGKFYESINEVHPPESRDAVKWNFTKFLVDRDGSVLSRYEPPVLPSEIEADVEKCL